ncbi:kinase-like domain-containing protein [Lentinula aciculospora]|uniref:Kinase-like domain-containing protein n=1 Tax=Lentinula aciculospora TaxID=153920 RepID=A0A9W9A993_9AGAR|nr:kinase-like domain-containing protein [Lentinula aciculospora]
MQALNTPPSFSHPILSSSHLNMASFSSGASLPQFIGAVEDHWQLFSDRSSDYVLGAPIGFGASSIVYAALYHPPNRQPLSCALKVLDLDTLPLHSWSLLQRETTLMSLSKHPNVLRVRGSWMDGHKLFIALRLMNKGSAADVMRYGWPGGLEEDVIKCILEQALQGLNYLHINGFIHRDVKAANLLIDDDGTVLLGDLGVAADLSEGSSHTLSSLSSSNDKTAVDQNTPSHAISSPYNHVLIDPSSSKTPRIGKRKSFVGTPCWMAPELIQGKQYDSSADIWSFGITALELTQGRPPRSREPPQKVLLRTIQDDPPTLDRESGTYKYSKGFQEMVESCLVKDPSKRPTAQQLLQTPFFRGTKKKSYLINAILKDLPPLTKRQERRVLPNNQIYRTVDSWDFTIHSVPVSPTSSNSKRRSVDRSMMFEIEGDPESKHHPAFLRSGKRVSGTPPSSAHTTQIRSPEPVEELDPGAVEPEEKIVSKPLDQSEKTIPPDTREKSVKPPGPEKLLGDTLVPSVSAPITISKPFGSSLIPPQDDSDLSTSPSSMMTNSASSQTSSSMGEKMSLSRSGLWHRIKGKTGSHVRKATSLGRLTSRDGSTSKR